jgi:hypothetical protein
LLLWFRRAEEGLNRELTRCKDTETHDVIAIRLALLRIYLVESLLDTPGKEAEAWTTLDLARQALAAFLEEHASYYDGEAMLIYVDFILAHKLDMEGKRTEAETAMSKVLDRAQKLAERPWGVDDVARQPQTWVQVARCHKWLGDWAAQRNPKEAELHYRQALVALAQATIAPGRMEIQLRVQAALLGEEIGQAIAFRRLDPKLAADTVELVRKEWDAIAAQVGDRPWLDKVRAICDVLLAGFQLGENKDTLPLVDKGIAQLEKYLRDHGDDQQARFFLAVGHWSRAGSLALFHDNVEAALREIQQMRDIFAKLDAKGDIGMGARALDRHAQTFVVQIHWMNADALLKTDKPEAARKALDHIEAGQKALADIQKKDQLNDKEKEAQEQLKRLKAKAEERLPKK